MRFACLLLVAAAVAPGLACGDDCDDRLEVELPAGFDGAYVFEGTADGTAFRCDYRVRVDGGEQVEATPEGCTGPAHLRIVSHADAELGLATADVRAVLEGAPETVAWTWSSAEPVGGADAAAHETGTLAPAYRSEDGCRVAGASVP